MLFWDFSKKNIKVNVNIFSISAHYGLALDIPPNVNANPAPERTVLDEIFSPVDYHLAPKHRRSRERRMQRQFGEHQMKKMIDIKQNLIMCLECGHWHEKRTICGKVLKENTL